MRKGELPNPLKIDELRIAFIQIVDNTAVQDACEKLEPALRVILSSTPQSVAPCESEEPAACHPERVPCAKDLKFLHLRPFAA